MIWFRREACPGRMVADIQFGRLVSYGLEDDDPRWQYGSEGNAVDSVVFWAPVETTPEIRERFAAEVAAIEADVRKWSDEIRSLEHMPIVSQFAAAANLEMAEANLKLWRGDVAQADD